MGTHLSQRQAPGIANVVSCQPSFNPHSEVLQSTAAFHSLPSAVDRTVREGLKQHG